MHYSKGKPQIGAPPSLSSNLSQIGNGKYIGAGKLNENLSRAANSF